VAVDTSNPAREPVVKVYTQTAQHRVAISEALKNKKKISAGPDGLTYAQRYYKRIGPDGLTYHQRYEIQKKKYGLNYLEKKITEAKKEFEAQQTGLDAQREKERERLRRIREDEE